MTWDRECRPACKDHRNSTNGQCVTHCPVAGLARALGISSLVSLDPGFTIPRTSTNNWSTHEKNSSAGA